MKPTKEQVKLVNKLIRKAIDLFRNFGGTNVSNGEDLYKAMFDYRHKIWGSRSGVCILWEKEYPYFEFIEKQAVGQHKEME